jgi:YgiT-type zinc finger domain-containing protein
MNQAQPNGLISEKGEREMNTYQWKDKLVEQKVTYTLDMNGQLIVIENVPARVNVETGEQLFSPDTVERLQKMVWQQSKPKRVIQVPVYEYA